MTYTVEVEHSELGLGYFENVSEEKLAWLKRLQNQELTDGTSFTIVKVVK